MILHDLPPGTTLFRAHTPRWASRPLSGAGAAHRGGRFNREGIEALYLSLDELTALREYQQTSTFLPHARCARTPRRCEDWSICASFAGTACGTSCGMTGAKTGVT